MKCLSYQRAWRENQINTEHLEKASSGLLFFFFLAALGLHCCTWVSRGKRGLLFVVVRGLLIVVASLAVEHGL